MGILDAAPDGSVGLGPLQADLLWLYLGPIQAAARPSWPSSALVLWGADVLARKGAALGRWRELATPAVPGGRPAVRAGRLQRPGHACSACWRCSSACSGRPGCGCGSSPPSACSAWPASVCWSRRPRSAPAPARGQEQLPAGPAHLVPRPARATATSRTPATSCAGPLGDRQRRLVRRRAGQGQRSSGAGCPTPHNDFIFAVIAEELGVVGCTVVLALFAVLAYTGLRIARRVADPFRRLAATAHHHLAGRPGRDQHRRRGRAAADHRPAAAVHLRRRQRPGRDAGRRSACSPRSPAPSPTRPEPCTPVRPPDGYGYSGPRCRRFPAPRRPAAPRPAPSGARRRPAAAGPTAGRGEETLMGPLRSVVLAGGGTGGHIYPLLAFADCLRRHDPDVRITCAGQPQGHGERADPAGRLRPAA